MEEKKRARVTLTIRDDILAAARQRAAQELRSLSNLVEVALVDLLEDAEK